MILASWITPGLVVPSLPKSLPIAGDIEGEVALETAHVERARSCSYWSLISEISGQLAIYCWKLIGATMLVKQVRYTLGGIAGQSRSKVA